MSKSFFLVIEGLDGSGKTEVARRLVQLLRRTHGDNVKLTFEPHDPSCSGLFIRQVLMGKIKDVSPRTLALAFAVNRADHSDREITSFLDGGEFRVVVCDRYYLSSLVYQAHSTVTREEIMMFNSTVRRPDLTIFLNASEKTCNQRMKRRQEDKQLFEKNLTGTRGKYRSAIEFLREQGETILEVDAEGDILEVLYSIVNVLDLKAPDWISIQPALFEEAPPEVFSLNGDLGLKITDIADELWSSWDSGPILGRDDFLGSLVSLQELVNAKVSRLSFNELGSIFLNYLETCGYKVIDKFPWTDLDAFILEYNMPLQILQRGVAILLGEAQRYDLIMKKKVPLIEDLSDFMLIFDPGPLQLIAEYYERDLVQYSKENRSVSPATWVISRADIAKAILAATIMLYIDEYLFTFRGIPELRQTLAEVIEAWGLQSQWDILSRPAQR